MEKSKSKDIAVGIMMVLGSILVLLSIWELPHDSLARGTKDTDE
jgi:hypothetical protein